MLLRVVTNDVVQILHKYFTISSVEDKPRIRAILRTMAAESTDWQREIEGERKQLERMIMEGLPLVQIAATLEVPVDELEKFCASSTLSPLFREQANTLDKDVPMYKRTKQGLRKREARRLAYEELRNGEELKNTQWAIRMILGANKQHFQSLQDYAYTYGKEQSGLGAVLPATETKHELNRILCETFCRIPGKKSLAIFEPTQGYGDGTRIFANYGLVVSVEKEDVRFTKAFDAHKHHAADLLEHVNEEWPLEELLSRYEHEQRFRVLMPPNAMNAYKIISEIQQTGWRFDIIDVDPFEDIHQMVEASLPLVNDLSLLFVSVNPNPRYGRSKEIAKFYREQDTSEFREQLWRFDCWRYMWMGVTYDIALVPIVVHKCWTPSERQGIDRLYFAAIRHPRSSEVVREYLDTKILKKDKTSPITQYQDETIPIVRFGMDVDDTTPMQIPNVEVVGHRLKNMLAQLLQI